MISKNPTKEDLKDYINDTDYIHDLYIFYNVNMESKNDKKLLKEFYEKVLKFIKLKEENND